MSDEFSSWTALDDGPFPNELQGKWLDETTNEIALEIDGRRLLYYGRPLEVGTLQVADEDGWFAVRNEGPDRPSEGWYWSSETLHIFWIDPSNGYLNFHGIGDHGRALPRPV